ncbi:hypothetical protein [Sphingomonas oligophenolica]|uniref:Uncharacterized protein n=1 Tax=Sphingomonas oligophenolica TaxID=301154 RepID=A0A502CG93_9SPHN|nr:hypothetical protein [Sphingomonas oligophenolica]TPG10796.1 hypothetical protein EAH84_11965 [Sphingomonas oligophenolica]
MTDASIADRTLGDPAWLAHRYDPEHDAVHFLRADRRARAAATFLIDAELPADAPRIIARADAIVAAAPAAPIHFIFHSAYCCSTLLARALDIPGVASTLREPQMLNDLVGWRHRGGKPAAIAPVIGSALDLLARPFERNETVVVKPSNVFNGLIEPALGLRPAARAILLYAPLRSFIASIARKGMWGRLWVRELLSKQLMDGIVHLGFESRDYFLLTDLQAAAVGWLAQQALFTQLAAAIPDRARMLDSETLVNAPAATLRAVAGLFDLILDDATIEASVKRDFGRDAKTGTAFPPGQRQTNREAGESLHADEIDKVLVWATAVADTAGVAVVPPAELALG